MGVRMSGRGDGCSRPASVVAQPHRSVDVFPAEVHRLQRRPEQHSISGCCAENPTGGDQPATRRVV